MRNQLAIAIATIEACCDGKLEPTPARLEAVLEALGQLDKLIDDIGPREEAARDTSDT